MRRLEALETQPEAVFALVSVLENPAACSCAQSRLLAVISLKNIVKRRWVKRGESKDGAVAAVSKEEKAYLKLFILTFIANSASLDSGKRVHAQISVLLSKIAAKDWPAEWPELLPFLYGKVQSTSDWRVQMFAMRALKEALGVLASKPLPMARQRLLAAATDIFPALVSSVWVPLSQQVQQALSGNGNVTGTVDLLEHMLTTTKVMSILLEKAYGVLAASLPPFFDMYVSQLTQYCAFIGACENKCADAARSRYCGLSDSSNEGGYDDEALNGTNQESQWVLRLTLRVIKVMSNVPVVLQREYPLPFAGVLQPFLIFYYGQVTSDFVLNDLFSEHGSLTMQHLCLCGVIFMANVLSCNSYVITVDRAALERRLEESIVTASGGGTDIPTSQSGDDAAKAMRAACTIRAAFFTDETVIALLRLMVSHLLRYTHSDLEEWKTDPERFVLTQQGLSNVETIKAAAETLFLYLLDTRPDAVCGVIMSYLSEVPYLEREEQVLALDAVYLCAGLAATSLSHRINAGDFLTQQVGPLLSHLLSHPRVGATRGGQQVLRCRMMWLLSCWMYQFEQAALPQILGMLCGVVQRGSGSDAVVYLEVFRAIGAVVKTALFQPEMLSPHILRLVEALCLLADELLEPESRSAAMSLVAELLLVSGPETRPIVLPLSAHLYSLWARAGGEGSPLLRSAILDVYKVLVRTAGPASSCLYPQLLPVLHVVFTAGGDEGALLAGDAAELWLALCRGLRADMYSQQLEQVCASCIGAIFSGDTLLDGEESINTLQSLMLVLEAHAIVGKRGFLLACGDALALVYSRVVGNIAARAVQHALRPVEALLMAEDCVVETCQLLCACGALQTMLRACFAATTQLAQAFQSYEEPDVVVVVYLSVIHRLLLGGQSGPLLQASSLVLKEARIDESSQPDIIFVLCRLSADKFDSVGYRLAGSWHRRLWCLSLLHLQTFVGSSGSSLAKLFPEIVNIALDSLSDEDEMTRDRHAYFSRTSRLLISLPGDVSFFDDDEGAMEAAPDPLAEEMLLLLARDGVAATGVQELAKAKVAAFREALGSGVAFVEFCTCVGNDINKIL